jgi:hypothetical protein
MFPDGNRRDATHGDDVGWDDDVSHPSLRESHTSIDVPSVVPTIDFDVSSG